MKKSKLIILLLTCIATCILLALAGLAATNPNINKANGSPCTLSTQCASGFCKSGATAKATAKVCSPCSTNADCGSGKRCNTAKVCVALFANGNACAANSECASGYCQFGEMDWGTCATRAVTDSSGKLSSAKGGIDTSSTPQQTKITQLKSAIVDLWARLARLR